MNGIPENVVVKRFSGREELCREAAEEWLDAIAVSAQAGKRFSVALSGGRIARAFFSTIVFMAQDRELGDAMRRVDFFWADERCVPPDDLESNFRIANELLFRPLGIEPGQVHRIRGEESPEKAALMAREDFARNVQPGSRGVSSLDIAILGMGEDGHVASLFPGEPVEAMNSPEVYRAVIGPKPPPNRVTLGYGAIASARQVWVLVSGEAKESALRASLRATSVTPLGRVLRQRTLTMVFTDIGPS